MSNEVDKNEVYAAISAQRALLGIITPNLRAVTIKVDSQRKMLKVCFFIIKIFQSLREKQPYFDPHHDTHLR